MSDNPKSRADRVSTYQSTIDQLKPNIAVIDHDPGMASIAISLRRLADGQEKMIAAVRQLEMTIAQTSNAMLSRLP